MLHEKSYNFAEIVRVPCCGGFLRFGFCSLCVAFQASVFDVVLVSYTAITVALEAASAAPTMIVFSHFTS